MKKHSKFRLRSTFLLLAGIAAAYVGVSPTHAENKPFYSSSDLIKLIIPYEPGGGGDALGTLIAAKLPKYIEGGPKMQVIFQPGANGVLGTNTYVSRAKRDGMTLLLTSTPQHMARVLGQEGVQFTFDQLKPFAGFPSGGVVYGRTDTPFTTTKSLFKGNQPRQIKYAGQGVSGEMEILLLFEMMGTDVNPVLGYGGGGDARKALLQGESDIRFDRVPAYKANVEPLVKEKTVTPLMTFGVSDGHGGLVPDPNYPDLPTPDKVYQEVTGKAPSGDAWDAFIDVTALSIALNKTIAIHPDAPKEAIAALEAAFQKLLADEGFKAESGKQLGGYKVMTGEQLATQWKQAAAIDPKDKNLVWLKEWAEKKYNLKSN